MNCHYTYDSETNQKVLIPGCMSVVHSNDINDCCCGDLSFNAFENQRYNELISQRNETIKELQNEVQYLHTIIEKLKQ